MTTFVSTLGFNTSHLQNLIVDEDVGDGDHLILVRPDDDDSRGKGAVQDIENFVREIDPDIETKVLEFDPDRFEDNTASLVSHLNGIEDELVVNLAGGDRALVIALSLASMTTNSTLKSTYIRSDVTHKSNEVELPSMTPNLDGRDREVLEYVVENGPVSNTRIASMTEMSESTIHRSIDETLEEMGYVEVREDGGKNSVHSTFPGEIAYKNLY